MIGRDRILTDEERQDWREEVGAAPRRPRPENKNPAEPAAPVTKKKPPPPPPLKIMGKRRAEAQFNPHRRIEAKIDLHGMTQDEAHDTLIRFLTRAHAAGKRHVAVITGKGRGGEGVLKRAVPHWLELPALRPLVAAMAYAPADKGGEGVLHLLLKKPRD